MPKTVRPIEDVLAQPPFVLRWNTTDKPMPVRIVQNSANHQLHPLHEAPPWLDTGPMDKPFDFGPAMYRLCADVVAKCPEFAHIDVNRLLIAVTQARNPHNHGLQARVTPLRFAGGKCIRKRRYVSWHMQRFVLDDVEFLYLITFCLPRYLDQQFDDKLVTLFHELHHISPAFDGDLRRFQGRYCLHSHSQKQYDEHMAELSRAYMTRGPADGVIDFLRLSFAQLQKRHGSVVGVVVPRPQILPFRN